MAGFVLGAGSGILAGAAVYYTLATGIQQNTALLRSEITNSSRVLESSFDPVPAPAASSLVGPAYPSQASFSELLRHKWNNAVGAAVSGVRDANWSALSTAAVGAAQGAATRIGTVASELPAASAAAADKTGAVAQAAPVAAVAAAVVKDAKAAADKAAEAAKLAQLRAATDVDAPARPSEKVTESPKRLV